MSAFPSLLVCTNPMWSDCHVTGNMPPIVTEPTVIHCKVNSTVSIKFLAQDPNGDQITFSLLYPRPPGASISSGETHIFHSDIKPQKPSIMLTFVSGMVSQHLDFLSG